MISRCSLRPAAALPHVLRRLDLRDELEHDVCHTDQADDTTADDVARVIREKYTSDEDEDCPEVASAMAFKDLCPYSESTHKRHVQGTKTETRRIGTHMAGSGILHIHRH